MRAWNLACLLAVTGCFSDPPPASGGESGSSGTTDDETSTGQIPTSPGTSTTDPGTDGDPTTSNDTDNDVTSGCADTDDCGCPEVCAEGSVCDGSSCVEAEHCVVSWGGLPNEPHFSAVVTPVTASGLVGQPVVTPTDYTMSLPREALGAGMLVPCGQDLYAVATDVRTIVRLRFEANLDVSVAQALPLEGNSASLYALACMGDRLLAASALHNEASADILQLQTIELSNDGTLVGPVGQHRTVALDSDEAFESVRLAWTPPNRGYLAFDIPGDAPRLELRELLIDGNGDVSFANNGASGIHSITGYGDQVGAIAVTPSGDHLAIVGLRDGNGFGLGGRFPLDQGNLEPTLETPGVFSELVWGQAKYLTFAGPPIGGAMFSADYELVFADLDGDVILEQDSASVPGSGSGAVMVAENSGLLVLANSEIVSTFELTAPSLGMPVDQRQRPLDRHAGSVLRPCE